MIVITTLLFALAGACSGVMDVIDDKFDRSIFKTIKNEAARDWFESDWRRKYIAGNPEWGVRILFGFLPAPPFIWDGWHCAKSVMLVFLIGAISIASAMVSFSWWHPLAYSVAWWTGFESFYEYFGIQKGYRRNYFKTFWNC